MPLIGAADDLAVAATARGPAIASAIASLRTWIFMETPIRVEVTVLRMLRVGWPCVLTQRSTAIVPRMPIVILNETLVAGTILTRTGSEEMTNCCESTSRVVSQSGRRQRDNY